MDQTSPLEHPFPRVQGLPAQRAKGPGLALVNTRFRLAQPAEAAPDAWQQGLDALLAWLGIDAEFLPAARPRRLPRLADWAMAPAAGVPVFAPWLGWSPVAFQHGGIAALPAASFVASYGLDHARGAGPGQDGTDLLLMSPHPSACAAEEAGAVPVPRAGVMKAMIRTAREEGRGKLAIILHARQRNAVAAQLLAAGKGLTREGLALDILTIEEALPLLVAPRAPWDAIIAMPDVRGTVFTLLAATSGLRGPWPMLWFASDASGGRTLRLATAEAPGEGASRLPLDAPVLVQTLALALHAGGAGSAARRLHEGWARLRDSGVTTPGRGGGDAPYASEVADSAFIGMICRDAAVSKRAQREWRALENAKISISRTPNPHLRVVS